MSSWGQDSQRCHCEGSAPTNGVIPSAVPPPLSSRLERPPTLSSRLERKRNGGIYRSWYDAGECEDSSTSLRFGRNDIVGGSARNDLQVCHPDWSASGMEGSIAAGSMRGSARIPPLRYAPVGMTCGGGGRNDIRICHPERSASQTVSSRLECPPTLSSRLERSGMEGSTAVGSMQGSARIPPLRYASVGMT